MARVIEQTDNLSLLTDGERRYGNILFDICHDIIRNGKPGRPLKRLPKGVRVRIKNKGAKTKKGRPRQKYHRTYALTRVLFCGLKDKGR
ncbi:hypothetical protein [Acaryochloris sp. CCMEE 5410]|uniref:hypothetical protein n=1 Tax=Acaryochloris sp. CCMEE 5410 TaxID=310037 RepID=UPI000248490A|nr:hypothetical protein [Acaryochloris sp. CCMEE 5410]KAI9131403.1 hypothetical protein ON05_027700 [Acaryochloris sp. CCMEE 5410]